MTAIGSCFVHYACIFPNRDLGATMRPPKSPCLHQVHKARLVGAAAERGALALWSLAGVPAGSRVVLGSSGLPVAVKIVPFIVNSDSYDTKSLQVLRQEVQVCWGQKFWRLTSSDDRPFQLCKESFPSNPLFQAASLPTDRCMDNIYL